MAFRIKLPLIDVGDGVSPASGAELYVFEVGTSTPKTTYSNFALTVTNTHPVVADANGIFSDIFVADQCDVSLYDGNSVLVYGPKTVYAPDDSVVALAGTGVTIADAGGYYTAVNAETVLQEIGANYLRSDREETVTADMTFSSAELRSPILRDYTVKHNSVSSSSGTLTIDLNTGNSFSTTLTENITTMTVTGIPASGLASFVLEITQDGAGGAYTVALPSGSVTPGGSGYTMSTGNDAIDDLAIRTIDGGTEWKVDFSQAYA